MTFWDQGLGIEMAGFVNMETSQVPAKGDRVDTPRQLDPDSLIGVNRRVIAWTVARIRWKIIPRVVTMNWPTSGQGTEFPGSQHADVFLARVKEEDL